MWIGFQKTQGDIIVTLDCHYDLHIAHPSWFIDEAGNNPPPFTSYQLVEGEIIGGTLDASGFHPDRKYRCANPVFTNWTNHYLKELLNRLLIFRNLQHDFDSGF